MRRGFGVVVLSCAAVLGCGTEGSPTMRPGEDCLSCHASGDKIFTAAGTVFDSSSAGVSGVSVVITDSNGTKVTMTSNSAGNFYTSQALAFPAAIELQYNGTTVQMGSQPGKGGCNSCHSGSGSLGRIQVP
jgi:hypothetical protein